VGKPDFAGRTLRFLSFIRATDDIISIDLTDLFAIRVKANHPYNNL